MATSLNSRVFMNGNSQAVRIPQEFRLDSSVVVITRADNGDLLIRPVPEKRGDALLQALTGFDAEFVALLEAGRREQPEPQEREPL